MPTPATTATTDMSTTAIADTTVTARPSTVTDTTRRTTATVIMASGLPTPRPTPDILTVTTATDIRTATGIPTATAMDTRTLTVTVDTTVTMVKLESPTPSRHARKSKKSGGSVSDAPLKKSVLGCGISYCLAALARNSKLLSSLLLNDGRRQAYQLLAKVQIKPQR